MKKTVFVGLAAAMLLLVSQTRAVTDEEIRKMEQAMPTASVTVPAQTRTLLVFNLCNGFKHSSVPYWQAALEIMAKKTGAFTVVQSSDMAVFSAESLKEFDAICFNNTTKLTPDAAQQKAILDFVNSGKGIVGIHAATDNFDDWPEGAMMMGGIFKGHPWGGGGTWAIKIDEPEHPLMKPFAGKGFKVNDEIYRTLPPQYSRANQRVLMSLDMSDPATKNAKGVTPEDMDTGISWIKPVGKGRLFYCSLGHNHHLTWTTPVLEHYLAGIQYAMGDLKADDTPLGAADDSETNKLRELAERISGYQWDQSRAPLAEMEQFLRESSSRPETRKAVESVLLDALKSESTPAAKDFICRILSMVGTDASVPVLSQLLKDEATFDMALYALDRIPGDNADAALLAALGSAKDSRQIAALVTSLGKRKCGGSVALIAAAAGQGDAVVAETAIEALASIGGSDAINALGKMASNSQLKVRAQDALLRCADALSRSGKTQEARRVYEQLFSKENVPQIRSGALLGLAAVDSGAADKFVIAALKGEETLLARAAVNVIAQTENKTLLNQVIRMAGTLPPVAQVQLVTALAENPLGIGGEAAEKLAASSDKQVRLAAMNALSVLGSEQSVLLLSSAAASSEERDERQAAQNALYSIAGNAADQAILVGINDDTISEDARVELIQAAVQRQSDATAALLEAARSSNSKIASQSIRALQSLAGPEDVQALTELVADHPGATAENTLAAAALKIENTGERASALLVRYSQTASPEAKASLLRVMGRLGDQNSVELITREFGSSSAVVSEAAFRAMTDWPGTDFAAKLKNVSQSSTDVKTKVMAYRAFVRMLGSDAAALIDAYALAPRPEEQKAVLGALAGCGSEQALAFAQTLAENANLKTEAEMCMIGICEHLKSTQAESAAVVLRKLADSGSTDAVKKRASDLLK